MTTLDTRRIYIFLACAFGLAWATALVIYLTGGLVASPALIPDTGFTLAFVLVAGVYMFSNMGFPQDVSPGGGNSEEGWGTVRP